MPTYFYTPKVQTFIPKFVRAHGKIRAFLVLKYIQKHLQIIETTVMKMHTDTVESPFLPSRRPLGQARAEPRAPGRPARPAAPRSSHLPVGAPKPLRSRKSGNITDAQGDGFGVSVAEWSTGAKNGDKNHIAGKRTQARTFPHGSSDGKQSERNGTTV